MKLLKDIALRYNELFGFNVLPLQGKRPIINWDKWQSGNQTCKDINVMEWSNASGLGSIMGIKDLRCIDIDEVENPDIVKIICSWLGLNERYEWVVQSGSGKGYHIYFRSKMTLMNQGPTGVDNLEEKAVYKYKLKQAGYCKHIELRWKKCQTALPPSIHDSGRTYRFYYDDPKESPIYVKPELISSTIENHFILKSAARERKTNADKNEVKKKKDTVIDKVYYDKERLENAIDFLSNNLPDNCYEEWYRIGFALVSIGDEGEKYFIKMSLNNSNYSDTEREIKKKFRDLKKEYDGKITLGTLFHIAEVYGWKKPVIKFWAVDDNGKVKINRTRYKRFLESEGFCKYKMESITGTGSNYVLVKIENNIVEEIDLVNVKEFVMNYLDALPIEEFTGTSKVDVIDALIKSNSQIFTNHFLEFLITKHIEFNKDTKDKGYFYFRNGFIEISKEDIHFNDYSKLEKYIWKKQMLRRNYTPSLKRSVFEELLFNICKSGNRRYEALKSSIGYLLHNYKDPSISKAVIFIDEKLSEGAFGRSGKGLVIKGISHIRNVVVEDGRNFNPSKNFAFQRVKVDTNLIAIEDIRDKFPFEKLFSIITDGIIVERKNKDEVFIPFQESPKVIMSTNFSITGIDDSTIDRQFIIEFSDYYNKNHRPVDDFGKLFFDGWNANEWNDFDCFMIECLQFYLNRSLLTYDYVNIEKKKLISETISDFAEFSECLEMDKEYDKKELYESFISEYVDFDPYGNGSLSRGKFGRWLKVFARVKGFEVVERKSGATRIIKYKQIK